MTQLSAILGSNYTIAAGSLNPMSGDATAVPAKRITQALPLPLNSVPDSKSPTSAPVCLSLMDIQNLEQGPLGDEVFACQTLQWSKESWKGVDEVLSEPDTIY